MVPYDVTHAVLGNIWSRSAHIVELPMNTLRSSVLAKKARRATRTTCTLKMPTLHLRLVEVVLAAGATTRNTTALVDVVQKLAAGGLPPSLVTGALPYDSRKAIRRTMPKLLPLRRTATPKLTATIRAMTTPSLKLLASAGKGDVRYHLLLGPAILAAHLLCLTTRNYSVLKP
jgi:hypothetical protein